MFQKGPGYVLAFGDPFQRRFGGCRWGQLTEARSWPKLGLEQGDGARWTSPPPPAQYQNSGGAGYARGWGTRMGWHARLGLDTLSAHGGLGEGRDLLPSFERWGGGEQMPALELYRTHQELG